MIDFRVVLGPDYAGKSTALSVLAAESGWRVVSVDEQFLDARHRLLATLRRHLVDDVLAAEPGTYSREFAIGLMQCAVVYLRDRIAEVEPGTRVLVDSYYYKMLAKWRVVGVADDHPLLAWWRSLPQPRQVIYLDVDPETAWHRSGRGTQLNPLEYHRDSIPDHRYSSFVSYQRALREAMFDEIGALPVHVVRQRSGIGATAAAIRKVLRDNDDC
ncbi:MULTISPECIES: hypothetical protein [unclassified Nocardia]|uniref:hypothetical protein n=1 Tax=unclassified Nocardia TaxID=2637762 RepID=UPI001CE43EF8|nr:MULTISPECIES: hypothetical protein [unclassified Nocardia]